ncbi:uncharacterized protein LOC106468302 [Limulus polyphemus]|uniref:Uncharacterized protein LOC106468302 n=1 Tax=Limulus polyphemus TaxID=6850 RepID=A0ABM1BL47_LIMPO|nr:uncharacterized protein LOC106468302 [Limulus polyphemus]
MTTENGRLRKLALCSGIAAGIAYLGYSVIKSALCEIGFRSEQRKNPTHEPVLKSEGCQTDLIIPVTSQPGPLPRTSVRDRIRELNLKAREFKEAGLKYSTKDKSKSLQNSPWNSPKIQKPVDGSSPHHQQNSIPKTLFQRDLSTDVLNDSEETLLIEQVDTHLPPLREPEEVLHTQLESLYSKSRIITFNEAKGLVTLLSSDDDEVLVKVLTVISNCSAYPTNQDHLADAGCPLILRDLIISAAPSVQVSVVQAIASLANSSKNQVTLQVCIPVLLRNATDPEASAYLRALSLTALANLALEKVTVAPYIGKLHSLLKLFEEGNTIKIQTLKLLNNLSLSPAMVPYLLATKCPPINDMLDNKSDRDITLQLLTFLGNVTTVAVEQKLGIQDLPADDRAPSPETLYSTVFGLLEKDVISKKMLTLSASSDEEISVSARKVYDVLSQLHQ